MLYLDNPIGPIRGLMVYGDHADPNLFYYVPERPRLARNDGVPEFVFLRYRRDITDNPAFDADTKQELGGGFLAFTVDLGVDDDVLKEAKKELARYAGGGEAKLAPVQFRKGSVRLTITKDAAAAPGAAPNAPTGMAFFEDVYGATTPSLFGFNRATFAIVLTAEAALLFEAALKSGISPIGVIYDLEFLGMRPAFDVHITANYHRVYSELDLEFGARGSVYVVSLGVDIGAAFQRLRDKGDIKVEVLNFTDDENLRKQADAAFDWFKTELLKEFFKPAIEPPLLAKSQAGGGGGLLGQLSGLLGPLGATQNGTSQPALGQPSPLAPTPAQPPKAQASGVAGAASGVTAAGGGTGAVPAAAGGGALGPSPAPFQVAFTLKYIDQVEDREREFDYSMQAAVAREAAPQGLFSTVVQGLDLSNAIREISLDDDFLSRLLVNVSLGTDLAAAGIATVAVNLEYPGVRAANEEPTHAAGFVFKPDQMQPGTFTNWLNDKKDLKYRYQAEVFFQPNTPYVGKDAHIKLDWEVSRANKLVVSALDKIGFLDVEVSTGKLNKDEVTQVEVELWYQDPANAFETKKTLVLKPGDPSVRWQVRLSDRTHTTYRYRLTYFLSGDLRYQTDWQPASDPGLIINDPFQNQISARLVPILDANNLIEADVVIGYQEADTGYRRSTRVIFTPQALATQEQTIRTLAKQPAGLTCDVTVIRGDGSVFSPGPAAVPLVDTKATVPVTDGEGQVKRVVVRLPSATDFSSSGLAALRVQLVGPGDTPDRAEALFTTAQTTDQTVVLVQPPTPGPFTYSYRVTGYTRKGIPVPGATGQDTATVLIVPLPVAPP